MADNHGTIESLEREAKDKLRSTFEQPLLFDKDAYAQMYDVRYLAKKGLPVYDSCGNQYGLSSNFFVNQGFFKTYR